MYLLFVEHNTTLDFAGLALVVSSSINKNNKVLTVHLHLLVPSSAGLLLERSVLNIVSRVLVILHHQSCRIFNETTSNFLVIY